MVKGLNRISSVGIVRRLWRSGFIRGLIIQQEHDARGSAIRVAIFLRMVDW